MANQDLQKGDILKLNNRYQVEEIIGDGGFGLVYSGINKKDGKKVAIKLFKAEAFSSPAESRMYWEREWQITKSVNGYSGRHMEYIEAYEDKTDRSNPKFYIILGFVEDSTTLKKWFNDNLRKSDSEKVTVDKMVEYLFIPMCDYMYYAQQQGAIHRDFTFNNILVVDKWGSPTPIVIDWGGGRRFDPRVLEKEPPKIDDMPGSGTVIITPGFYAPEIVMQKPPVPQTDIYMFGAVLFYALTNGYTRVKPTVSSDYILHPQDYNMNISDTLNDIVEKCTQFEPKDRFRHFGLIKEALQKHLKGDTGGLSQLPSVGGEDQFVLRILNNDAIIHLNPYNMKLEEGKNIRVAREMMIESAAWDEAYKGVFRGITRGKAGDKPRPREQFFLGYSAKQNLFYIHEGRNSNQTSLDNNPLPLDKWIPIKIGQKISVMGTTVKGVFELISVLDKKKK